MEYVGMFAQALAASLLVAVWSMVRENQDCEKADRNYIRALEDGVDELHAERKRLEEELSDAVHQNMALEHYASEPLVPSCPSCGSDDRAGKCFVPTGIGSGHVLCQSPWHLLVS